MQKKQNDSNNVIYREETSLIMKITGIIAEYNPFHNGHAYQIQKVKEETGSDYIIAAMSGDFVQRGEPAVIDKYARTKMALSCGADLVVELPALWATASAEPFAMAGVTLFDRLGCVDFLCFGTETENPDAFQQAADILETEPERYRKLLCDALKKGSNYPAARMHALTEYARISGLSGIPQSLLSSPNNILAAEYFKALKKRSSSIRPYPILRKGAGYHSTDIRAVNASASAIRHTLKQASSDVSDALSRAMPSCACRIFTDYLSAYPTVGTADFSDILNYLLLSFSGSQLAAYADCNIEIANRLKKNLCSFQSFAQFCELNKSRDITYTRMSRIFTHLLLHITDNDYFSAANIDYVPYIRPLGFRKESAPLLTYIKKHCSVPLLGKTADASHILSAPAQKVFEKDIFAAELYEQILARKGGTLPRSEYTREIVLF